MNYSILTTDERRMSSDELPIMISNSPGSTVQCMSRSSIFNWSYPNSNRAIPDAPGSSRIRLNPFSSFTGLTTLLILSRM